MIVNFCKCTALPQNRCTESARPIYYFILLLWRDAGHGSGPHRHGHAGGLAQVASAIRGCWREGRFCNQSADINIFRVSNRKLLRLLQRHYRLLHPQPLHLAELLATPCHCCRCGPSCHHGHLSPLGEGFRRRNPRCGLSGIIN